MSLNTITLKQAQKWAKNWNEKKVIFFQTRDLKAFTIPKQVLGDVRAHEDVADIRTYMGLDDEMNPHFIIVGVDQFGNDLIDPKRGLFIYNFAKPCPQLCNGVAPFINNG